MMVNFVTHLASFPQFLFAEVDILSLFFVSQFVKVLFELGCWKLRGHVWTLHVARDDNWSDGSFPLSQEGFEPGGA